MRRQSEHLIQLLPQESGVTGGHGVPGGGHGGDVVEHVALGLLHGAEVGHHLARLHDHLAQQQHAGAYDFPNHAHHADDGVHLLEVPAGGAQLLPDVRHRIDADNIDTPVGEVEEIGHHLIEHPGIAVV